MMPTLDVFLHEQFVGTLRPDRDKTRVTLDVDPGYHQDVLLSESFATLAGRRPGVDAVSNFLGGYVPEGNHRQHMAAKRRVDPDSLFALLSEFGGSLAGAITLRRQEEPAPHVPTYQPLDDTALAVLLKRALDDSDQGIPDDSRSTLPGYQPKVVAALFDGELRPSSF
jgi:serine/threonine-protein kinase HipA